MRIFRYNNHNIVRIKYYTWKKIYNYYDKIHHNIIIPVATRSKSDYRRNLYIIILYNWLRRKKYTDKYYIIRSIITNISVRNKNIIFIPLMEYAFFFSC